MDRSAKNHGRAAALTCCLFAALILVLVASRAGASMQEDQDDAARYLRVVEQPGESLTLEVAVRRFAPAEGIAPEVTLVGVAHIGDAILYESIEEMLESFDVVLFESVAPPGAMGSSGTTDEERIENTRRSMAFVAGLVELYHSAQQRYPDSPDALRAFLSGVDSRLIHWLPFALVDAWGEPVSYEAADSGQGFSLTSFGADGRPGGEGADADLTMGSDDHTEALVLGSNDGIQAKLAEMLGLEFQLHAIDYGPANFRPSDMTADQLERAFRERGLDFGPLSSTLAGSAFPPVLVDALVKLIRMLDSVFDEMFSDMTKVIMIEILSDESLAEQVLDRQFGSGFADVIIGERNQVVIDDLKKLIDDEPEVESVAILYGAAHMPDLAERLHEQLGYEPTAVEWIPALTVDLRKTALTESEIRQMRRMMRTMLRRMLR